MAIARPGAKAEIEDIRRCMAQIRFDLHEEVGGAVHGARSLTDWRSLVASYPWLSLGLAAALGYLIVPKRRRDVLSGGVAHVSSAGASTEAEAPQDQRRPLSRTRVVMAAAFSLVAPIVVRAAQNFVSWHIEDWLAHLPAVGTFEPAPSTNRAHATSSILASKPLSDRDGRAP